MRQTERPIRSHCRFLSRGGACLALAVAAGFAPSAYAQESSTQLSKIVVGTGEERVAVDTPQSVTVVDQDALDDATATTVGDVLDAIPGVNSQGSERVLGESFNIRGIGSGEAQADEGRFILQVDGVDKNYQQYRMGGLFTDPELFKRVEVLRGPASSTLYGAGALAGVIAFTTKDADDFLEDGETAALRLKSTYETNSDGLLGSAIGAWRPSERLSLLVATNYRRGEDYESGNGTEIDADFESFSGLVKGTAKVGEEGVVRASYQRWQSDGENQQYAQTVDSSGFGRVDRKVTDETAILAYENPFSANDWLDVKAQVSFSDTLNQERNSTAGFFVGPPSRRRFIQFFTDADFRYQTRQAKLSNTMEARTDSWENYLTVGAQYMHLDRDLKKRDTGAQPEGTEETFGFYVQNEFIYDERLTVIAGVRLDWRELTPDQSVVSGFGGNAGSVDDVAFSPKVAALYKLNENWNVFGSYAHTERFATLDELYDYRTGALPGYGLDTEKSDNFEVGFSYSVYDVFQDQDAFQFKATGFVNTINGFIARNPLTGSTDPIVAANQPAFANVGDVRLKGVELELGYGSATWFGSAGASFIEGEDLDYALSTSGHLNTVPPAELFVTLGRHIEEFDLSFGYRGRFVAAQDDVLSNVSSVGGRVNGRVESDGFALHGLFMDYKPDEGPMKGLEFRASVENLFDKEYKEFLYNDPGKGRTLRFSLSKKFGI